MGGIERKQAQRGQKGTYMAVSGYLRKVEESDKKMLFEWANDPETRRQSFSTSQITWEEHETWFERKKADPACYHFVMMVKEDEADCEAHAAGVIRLDRDNDHAGIYIISSSVAPNWRGKGCGKLLFVLTNRWASALIPDCKEIEASVKQGNPASMRGLEKAGYQRMIEEEQKSFVRFRMKITHENLIYFRADANAQIGFGHMMRCLTIADACVRQGMQPVFVTADAQGAQIGEKRGYPCVILGSGCRHTEREPEKLPLLLTEKSTLVLDSYHITADYVRALKRAGFSVAWMDDYGQEDYPADIRINYNLYAKKDSLRIGGESAEKTGKTVYLAGSVYAPVRSSFCTEKPKIRETVQTILITTGGGDPCGAGAFFAKELIEIFETARILVVCGPYADTQKLSVLSEEYAGIQVLTGLSDLSDVMHESDLAIAAAGSTVYELCAAAVPTVTYYFADNQKQGAEAFAALTGSVCLGDLRDADERARMPERMREAARKFADARERKTVAETMHALVDGKGADRIVRELAKLVFRKGL